MGKNRNFNQNEEAVEAVEEVVAETPVVEEAPVVEPAPAPAPEVVVKEEPKVEVAKTEPKSNKTEIKAKKTATL